MTKNSVESGGCQVQRTLHLSGPTNVFTVHLLCYCSLLTHILLSIQSTLHTTSRVIIKNANLTHFSFLFNGRIDMAFQRKHTPLGMVYQAFCDLNPVYLSPYFLLCIFLEFQSPVITEFHDILGKLLALDLCILFVLPRMSFPFVSSLASCAAYC